MAILTPTQLQASNNATYTTNGVGSITGASANSFNNDFISSSITVSQTSSLSVASASYAATASVVLGSVVSSSYALSASYALNADTASKVTLAGTDAAGNFPVLLREPSADNAGAIPTYDSSGNFAYNPDTNTLTTWTVKTTVKQEATGTIELTGSLQVRGSATLRPVHISTEYPYSIIEGPGTSTVGGNLISSANTLSSQTGSFTLSGSSNVFLSPGGASNANILAGYLYGINSSRGFITTQNINISGSNTSRPFTTAAGSLIFSPVNVIDDRPSTTTTPLTLNNSNINGTLSFTTSTGSATLTNVFTLGSTAIAITGSSGATKSLSIALFNGLGNTLTVDTPAAAGVGTGLLVAGNNNTLLSSGSSYSFTGMSVLGIQLSLTGSGATGGGAMVGRYNAQDSTAIFSNTMFAVGTGNASVRRTSLHVSSSGLTTVRDGLIVSSSLQLTGSLDIQSGSGDLFVYGHKQFNVGAFSSNISQSGSANVSQSMNFEITDISQGVSIASNSRITLANAGTYNIQFSAQILADTGADDVYIWLKKNGTNVAASAGHVVLANNEELIASWNYVVDAVASDYFELAWQSTAGDAILLTEAASVNIPSIPSVILTVTQVR